MSDMNLRRDFRFFRMWPRRVFQLKENGRLSIKGEVEELHRPGVYVLYKGDELYYVGKGNSLFSRLHDHSNKMTDRYYAHWDHFSAFAISDTVKDRPAKMRELEAILIAAMPRSTNSATPRLRRVEIPKTIGRRLGEN
jgi:predicted GIY-YIG superfamily endonuclease